MATSTLASAGRGLVGGVSDPVEHDHDAGHHGRSAQHLLLRVEGMTCAGCAATVQRAVESMAGVRTVAVSVADGRAVIEGAELDAAGIVKVINAHGYTAQVMDDLPAVIDLRSEIEERQIKHERVWKRRALIALGIWAPLEAMHWIAKAAGWHAAHGVGWMGWLMLAGSTIVIVAVGGGFYRSAWSAAKRGTTNMDTLIAIGATAAYAFSLVVFIGRMMDRLHDQPLYFAESAALLGLISLGHWLEARAAARAGSAVRDLLRLQPDEAEVLDRAGGEPRRIASADIKPGDHLLVRPGSRVAVDGVVVDGESDVDESVVTGESMPARKARGSQVVAGSMNTTGRLVVEAGVDGRHTTVARIADLVQRAQSSRAQIQRLADFVSSIFVPTVLVVAVVTVAGWAIAGDLTRGIIAMCTVLIISCPCALGLATPMAVMVGAGAASRRGILVKSAAALEAAGKATHVVFDKTGTLTIGQPRVVAISTSGEENDLLRLAASVEAPSEHPIARAIVAEAAERSLQIPLAQDFKAIAGQGVVAQVEGRRVEVMRDDVATCRIVVDGATAGTINLADEPRPDAARSIERLRTMNVRVSMLSGDRAAAAAAIARRVGIADSNVAAEATPQSKVDFVRRHVQAGSAGGGGVIMVGDGINDAAALAVADVGVAMASGTNIAMESADIVIPGDRVSAVAETIDIARRTLRAIKQNLFFAFIYNVLAIPAAALGLLGPYGPLIAAAAMGLSDITVIGNALRLKARLAR